MPEHLDGDAISGRPRRPFGGSLEPVPHPFEPSFLSLEAGENLAFPAFPQSPNPRRRNVNGHAVLEPRTEQSMHVRMRRPIDAAVLVNGEDALDTPQRTAERLVDRVTENACRQPPVEPGESCRCRVVDCQDETEVDRASQVSTVFPESPANGRLVATKRSVSVADPVELPVPPRGARCNAPGRRRASGCGGSAPRRRTRQRPPSLLLTCGAGCRSRSASAIACSHSSAPLVRTSASSSSSLTFRARSRVAQ